MLSFYLKQVTSPNVNYILLHAVTITQTVDTGTSDCSHWETDTDFKLMNKVQKTK